GWIGSASLLGCLLHALLMRVIHVNWPHPLVAAFLVHGTFVLLVSIVLAALVERTRRRSAAENNPDSSTQALHRLYAKPLYQSAFVTSLFALPLSFMQAGDDMVLLTAYVGSVSALWLVIACGSRSRALFAAFQLTLTVTVILVIT